MPSKPAFCRGCGTHFCPKCGTAMWLGPPSLREEGLWFCDRVQSCGFTELQSEHDARVKLAMLQEARDAE